ncbi:MAG: hypothetical protein DRP45_08045 [Candidatus Zixiibacteriota bacterium]|nr:MAG: hypothetical protein DRP45_08045 [candidate division Zixibacteria bacterium]
MKQRISIFVGIVLLAVLMSLITAEAASAEHLSTVYENFSDDSAAVPGSSGRDDHSGNLVVYMVEPYSRWVDAEGTNFGFGFLNFAMDQLLTIPYGTVWEHTMHWDAAAVGYGSVQDTNIMAIAVMFDTLPHQTDAFPPYEQWFNAYYVDAAAAATPGQPGQNETAPGFTHTVFVEEGTSDT